MTHDQVYRLFKMIFPSYANDEIVYFPNGKNSIRLRGVKGLHSDGQDLIFTTSNNHMEWRLETIDSFLKAMKGETKK